MLELRPNCECCNAELPPESVDARICSFECTFCASCAESRLGGRCPNCGGELLSRPRRPPAKLVTSPASTRRVHRPDGCGPAAKQSLEPTPYRDPLPTALDLEIVAAAGPDVLERIDAALLRAASHDWVKMARLYGDGVIELRTVLPNVTDVYCMHRLRELVALGRLDAEGDLHLMRFCRLRLA